MFMETRDISSLLDYNMFTLLTFYDSVFFFMCSFYKLPKNKKFKISIYDLKN